MEEVLIIGNPAEADACGQALAAFANDFATKRAELDELTAFKEEMDAKGAGANPYSRFDIVALEEAYVVCEAASAERQVRLSGEVDRLASIDSQKKEFASAAEDFLEWMRAEKAMLESKTPTASIHPDNAEEIAAGNLQLEFFDGAGLGSWGSNRGSPFLAGPDCSCLAVVYGGQQTRVAL